MEKTRVMEEEKREKKKKSDRREKVLYMWNIQAYGLLL